MVVDLSEIIAPSFYDLHFDILDGKHTHYWLSGGRGSTKSSFVSIEIILGIMADPMANAVVLRKISNLLRESVYPQLIWAMEMLGVEKYWNCKLSPLEMIYRPTGQKIVFRGAGEPRKLKSIKFKSGYCKFIWFEEVDQFDGMEEIRVVNQSLIRSSDDFVVFYSYNPPKSQKNWVNLEVLEKGFARIVHYSNYLSVSKKWLGKQFFLEAEHLKNIKPEIYKHEYLGEITGTGGEVFSNVTIRNIEDGEIVRFDRICEGIDWGYAIDPFTWVKCHYHRGNRKLFIFDEIYEVGLSNRRAAEIILQKGQNAVAIADCAEPKSIAEMKDLGIRILPARKGAGSVEFGMKFLVSDVEEIIIDNERCPNTAREFVNYEFEKDIYDNFKSCYPDKDNHAIDAIRYALEPYMLESRGKKGAIRVAGL